MDSRPRAEVGNDLGQRRLSGMLGRDPGDGGHPGVPGAHDEPLVGREDPNGRPVWTSTEDPGGLPTRRPRSDAVSRPLDERE